MDQIKDLPVAEFLDEKRWRRFTRSLLAVAVTANILAVASLAVLIIANEKKLLEKTIIPRSYVTARNVGRVVKTALFLDDKEALASILEAFAKEDDIIYLMGADAAGSTVAGAKLNTRPDIDFTRFVPVQEPAHRWLERREGPPEADIIMPVRLREEEPLSEANPIVGYIRLGITSAQMGAVTQSVFKGTFTVALLLLVPFNILLFLILRNMSARMQEALVRFARTAELERSNVELEQFAYVASHDLQEPLRMVSSFTQLLAKRYQGKLGADADDFIHYAVDGTRRMSQLINDLLAYSRITSKAQPPARVSSQEPLKNALLNLSVLIEETKAEITHDSMPEAWADPAQLTQVFQNLIGNGIKFRKKEEPPRVHVGVRRVENGWVFSVKDNGIGMDTKYADKIFTIFKRLHTREEYPGTGIGLAVVKKIVERHGGRIWVESEPGKGAVFSFILPDQI